MLFKPLKEVLIIVITDSDIVGSLVPKLIKWSSMGAEVNVVISRPHVDYARNMGVRQFLKGKKKYLFLVDSDTIPEVDGPLKLLKVNKDIVGGVYNLLMSDQSGQAIIMPSCYTLVPNRYTLSDAVPIMVNTGLQKCAMVATGYMMIKRKVFDKIQEPWFEYRWLDDKHLTFNGEDIDFCQKAEKLGIEMWCDTGALAKHCKQLLI